jgi:hypothetical protein
MPPQSRAQRRRQAARQQQSRPKAPSVVSAEAAPSAPTMGETIPLDPPTMAAPTSVPPRAVRSNRRVLTRPAPEPVDYSADYAAVRTDLRWIAIWTGLLFIAMFALYFSGLV